MTDKSEVQSSDKDQRIHEEVVENIKKIIDKNGYIPVSSLEKLELSKDQKKQMCWSKNDAVTSNNLNYYYETDRKDGQKVKVVIRINPFPSKTFGADIYSPFFYQGHGGNHDFSLDELKNNLQLAKEGERYPNTEK